VHVERSSEWLLGAGARRRSEAEQTKRFGCLVLSFRSAEAGRGGNTSMKINTRQSRLCKVWTRFWDKAPNDSSSADFQGLTMHSGEPSSRDFRQSQCKRVPRTQLKCFWRDYGIFDKEDDWGRNAYWGRVDAINNIRKPRRCVGEADNGAFLVQRETVRKDS
jgi:hypothetical protein